MRSWIKLVVPFLLLVLSVAVFADEGTYEEIYLVNGDFEEGYPESDGYMFIPEENVSGWQTTAPDGIIEIWRSGFNGVESYEGNYHAEINANMFGTLYQVVNTVPGTTIYWEFAHRGRAGVDSIALLIGAEDGAWIQQTVVTTGKDSWQLYSGSYMVPEGQTSTAFAYEAVSTYNDHPSIGNFLDGIRFGMFTPSAQAMVMQTPLACDGSFYVSMHNDTDFARMNSQTYQADYLNDEDSDYKINGLGFNHMDGYLYGISYKRSSEQSSAETFRIGANGQVVSLGSPSVPSQYRGRYNIINTSYIQAGTFLPDGSYLVAGPGGYLIINLPGLPPNASLTEPTVIEAGSFNFGGSGDLAVNPVDGKIYGYAANSRNFASFDIESRTTTPIGSVRTPRNLRVGAVFFTADGTLYAYGTPLEDGDEENTLYRVNMTTGEPVAVATGSDLDGNTDGASCPYGQEFSKSVTQEVHDTGVETGDVFTYTFTFSNMSGQVAAGINFTDMLPAELEYVGDTLHSDGTIVMGTVVGGHYEGDGMLSIQGMTFPVGVSSFTVDVRVVGEVSEPTIVSSQAMLMGSGIMGQSILSDDPLTPANDDATAVTILYNNLPPVISPIADQTHEEGTPIYLEVIAEDAGALRYTDQVEGVPTLPPGLSIDPATGVISGTLAVGSSNGSPYSVTISVIDAHGESASTSFTWTVFAPEPEVTQEPEGPVSTPDPEQDGLVFNPVEVCWTFGSVGASSWQ
ncbi:MAG: DUF11 domain-containing protein, partial [Anaerolineae bacterium]|nr:DUF11 domain-containing protein [Anaerolineae bacterium]